MKVSLLLVIATLYATISFAQWEFTLASGTNFEQLSLRPPAGASLNGFENSESFPGLMFSGQAGYRLNEQWAFRTRVAFVERNQEKGTLFQDVAGVEFTSNYVDYSIEAAYFFNPYFSVAVGGGPSINTGYSLTGPTSLSDIDSLVHTNGGFARGGIALEGHLRNFDARLEQTFGLSNARNELIQFTDANGAPLGPAQGSWGGVMLTVGYRFMLGQERYDPVGSLDSFFVKQERRFQAKHPRLAMDVGFGGGMGFLSPDGLFKDGTREVLGRNAAALRFDYQLNLKWSAISAIEFGTIVNDLIIDSLEVATTPIEQSNSFGLRAGLRYQPFKIWGASLDIASARIFNRSLTKNTDFYNIEALSPLRSNQVLGSFTGYLTAGRWEFFGRLSYTLTQPYTEALDSRFGAPTIRQNRLTDIQGGIHYRIFRRAG